MNNNKAKNNKFKTFLKTKILTKTFGISALAVVAAAALVGTLSYKYSNKNNFKPSFYNYQSYIDPDAKAKINENFNFKEFDEIQHFTKAILTNKAAAGIGNDSQAVQLIREGKLRKIDYVKMFGDPKFSDRNEVLKLLTETVKNHVESYNKYLTKDQCTNADGSQATEDRHLIDYFAPYFSQDMVVAYNPAKVLNLKKDDPEYQNKINAHQQAMQNHLINEIENNKGEFRLIDILKTLKANKYEYWEATNAVRDNMIYGSAYIYDANKGFVDDHATGKGTSKDKPNWYKEHIDHFVELFNDGTGYSVRDTKHVNFNGDGQFLLNNLIDPTSNTCAGLIYNGDAVDAYFSEDNYDTVPQSTIRFLRPKVNLLLVDGLVISENTSDYFTDLIYKTAHESYFGGVEKDNWINGPKWNNTTEEWDNTEGYESFTTFDFVGYTPAWKSQYEFVKNNYFVDDAYPQYIASLYEINKEQTIFDVDNKTPLTKKYDVKHFPIEPESKQTMAEIKVYYDTKLKS